MGSIVQGAKDALRAAARRARIGIKSGGAVDVRAPPASMSIPTDDDIFDATQLLSPTASGTLRPMGHSDHDLEAGHGLLGRPGHHAAAGALDDSDEGLGELDGELRYEGADVAAERARVEGDPAAMRDDAVCIRRLRKVYRGPPSKVAVRGLSLGVPRGQRFGLLGANGAGKSTTQQVLHGSLRPTSGDACVGGISVVHDRAAAQRLVGYCPQTDPLIDHLSAREHIRLFAVLKGVPLYRLEAQVEDLVARVGLPPAMAGRPAVTLSGGNKRKAVLAMALCGGPAVVLLDEPSSGKLPRY